MNLGTLVFIATVLLSSLIGHTLYINEFSTNELTLFQDPLARPVASDISFEEKSATHGVTESGCEFSAMLWEATDGVTVVFRIINCKSSVKAESTLQTLTKDATKIFESKTVKSTDRRKVGQRIVAAFSDRELLHPEVILWRRGSDVYRIESSSFAHALLFEKKWPNL